MRTTAGRGPLHQAVADIVGDGIDAARHEAREALGFSQTLWRSLDDAGLTRLLVPEADGGSGGSFQDLATVLWVCGYHGAPVPIAEANIAAWALSRSGQRVPPSPLALAVDRLGRLNVTPTGRAWQATGSLDRVQWAAAVPTVVTVARNAGAELVGRADRPELYVSETNGIAGDGSADIQLPAGGTVMHALLPAATTAVNMLSVSHALLITGAVRRVLHLTTQYAKARHQFGRPIAGFQAVGQQLAELAGAAEQADAMVRLPVAALSQGADTYEAALAAKICAAHAARSAIRVGHQIHGAIGVTEEYELHHHTERLMVWRDDGGSEAQAALTLGQTAVSDVDALWGLLTASPEVDR